MLAQNIYAIVAAALIASMGVWWFTVVLPAVKNMPKLRRQGIYGALWLAYFILVLIVINQTQQ